MTARAASELRLFAVTAPGLQEIAAGELRSLGMAVTGVEPEGVSFRGTPADLYRANLWVRTVSRVVARVGEFHARRFDELERHARRQPWERFVRAGAPVRLRVTCRKSRLYHSDAVAERVAAAIAFRTDGDAASGAGRGVPDAGHRGSGRGSSERDGQGEGDEARGDDDALGQLVIVRLLRDVCTVSIDSSGALLHRRGYRLAGARAPLRETLAAGTLLASGWPGNVPLLDPLCGSGTIPIEATLIARNIAPGARRGFAFMQWPDFDNRAWASLLADAAARELPAAPAPIHG
ncbi:MAG: THUMP domain-containing class I SAM-dependent RNA methyltransferase, partial [Gemmatimonadaceae bacterium]